MKKASLTSNSEKIIYGFCDNILSLSRPLKIEANIHFLIYSKMFDNGSCVNLTTHREWVSHYYKNYFFVEKEPNILNYKIKQGINYWKKHSAKVLSDVSEDARKNFDIDARIDFIYRDNLEKCYHSYSFYSEQKNADKAYSFYGIHSSKLINFIACFNQQASMIIAEANKLENRIIIPNYQLPIMPEKPRNFVAEMKSVGASVKLGDRETETLILYAAGYTSRQIGEMFCRSPKTIDKHIEHIKKKTGCKDRKDLHAYVRDIGLAGMERFFFSYFSH